MSDPLSAVVLGVIAWQVRAATGCPAGIAIEKSRDVMIGKYGASTPTPNTTFQIISEAVERASTVPVTDTYVVRCYKQRTPKSQERCKRLIRIPSGQVMGLCYQHGGGSDDR